MAAVRLPASLRRRWRARSLTLLAATSLVLLLASATGSSAKTFAALCRRSALASAAGGLWLANFRPQSAAAVPQIRAVTKKDLENIKQGYEELVAFVADWDKNTHPSCTDEAVQAIKEEGKVPSSCDAAPDTVRAYLGQRDTREKLYNTEQLWISIDAADMVDRKDQDEWSSAIDDFENYKQQAGDMSYTSSWALANPGGGRDQQENYLARSRKFTEKAMTELGKIVRILKL
eukprot:TRINITY_DN22907_c0_g1_i1.p2 TRINITY_DN22907_c0_g1~~TRINITY_DN22907_c0_g1_i1.p2  ORF type:complete len:250 (-),score=56.82 TRINITY_DN22907_c0_g1_i1:326-1021(-)